MSEDRSLDEFAGEGTMNDGGDAESDSSDAGVDGAPADADADETNVAPDPDPATPTADWTADGAGCERCGATVERRWLDDGDRVCADCKAW